jgi:hypothetical protein
MDQAVCERIGSGEVVVRSFDQANCNYSQINVGHWTATIERAAHHWVWKMISRKDGVPIGQPA